mgnify:CR=1 FL=1
MKRALLCGSVILLIDQLTKFIVRKTLPLYVSKPIIGDILRFTRVENRGMVFGIPIYNTAVFIIIMIIAIVGVVLLLLHERSIRSAIILGGAIGNLIDRVRFNSVTDFIDIGIKYWRYPTFNIADAAITIGIALIVIDWIISKK